MPMSEAARKAFGWPAELRHAPGPPNDERGGFRSACRCGYEGRWSKASPSAAYQHTKTHAEVENLREAGGGKPKEFAPVAGSSSAAPARPVVVSPRSSRPSGGTPCGCGCGEPSGGLFRPGHDSKLLSALLREVAGGLAVDDAVARMVAIGCSDKLQAKFIKRTNGAGVTA